MIKAPRLSFSNISTAVLVVFALLMLFSPNTKAWFIEKLMIVGLFQPDVTKPPEVTGAITTEVSFRDENGRTTYLSQLKGKVVFINFWATWCPPCIAEMPSLNKLYGKFSTSGDVAFLFVDADNDMKKAIAFLKKKGLNLPVHSTASAIPSNLFKGSLPTTVIINKAGEIVYNHEGAADYSSAKMEAYLKQLISAP